MSHIVIANIDKMFRHPKMAHELSSRNIEEIFGFNERVRKSFETLDLHHNFETPIERMATEIAELVQGLMDIHIGQKNEEEKEKSIMDLVDKLKVVSTLFVNSYCDFAYVNILQTFTHLESLQDRPHIYQQISAILESQSLTNLARRTSSQFSYLNGYHSEFLETTISLIDPSPLICKINTIILDIKTASTFALFPSLFLEPISDREIELITPLLPLLSSHRSTT